MGKAVIYTICCKDMLRDWRWLVLQHYLFTGLTETEFAV